MKKTILLVLAVLHIILSIIFFLVGNIYVFTDNYMYTWLPNLVVSLSLLILLIKESINKNLANLILIIYPLGLIFMCVMIFYQLPNFTYKEATDLVIQENFGKIDHTKEREVRGQNGMYYIYPEDSVYVFNTRDGSYARRLK
ncbi:hypothetical protein ACIQXI_05410 [Lysinibacillus sp. NPDC097195]|uniref:hypothetical protein n=1 Tax=Lysinibacillus sp. NPDC097195 TaxID=3364141 RepID=UPI00381A5052